MSDKPMFQKLEEFQEEVTYGNQAQAIAAGIPGADIYTAGFPEKNWVMTEEKARKIPGAQVFNFAMSGVVQTLITFPYAFFGKSAVMGTISVGVLENLTIPLDKLNTLNIKSTGEGQTNVPGTGYSWPVPMKPLTGVQRIERVQMSWQVHNLDVVPEVAMTPGEQVISGKCDQILAKLGA